MFVFSASKLQGALLQTLNEIASLLSFEAASQIEYVHPRSFFPLPFIAS